MAGASMAGISSSFGRICAKRCSSSVKHNNRVRACQAGLGVRGTSVWVTLKSDARMGDERNLCQDEYRHFPSTDLWSTCSGRGRTGMRSACDASTSLHDDGDTASGPQRITALPARRPRRIQEAFWAGQAERFNWHKQWSKVLEWDFADTRGEVVHWRETQHHRELPGPAPGHTRRQDRPSSGRPNDPHERQRCTSPTRELHERVCRYANVLKRNGAKKGDRICIYMPMVPELVGGRAGVCAHRCHPFGGVRGLQCAEPGRTGYRTHSVRWC